MFDVELAFDRSSVNIPRFSACNKQEESALRQAVFEQDILTVY